MVRLHLMKNTSKGSMSEPASLWTETRFPGGLRKYMSGVQMVTFRFRSGSRAQTALKPVKKTKRNANNYQKQWSEEAAWQESAKMCLRCFISSFLAVCTAGLTRPVNAFFTARRHDDGLFVQGVLHVIRIPRVAEWESFAVKYRWSFTRLSFSILTEAPPTLTASPILTWARPHLLERKNDWLELYSKPE